ncbi:hypothetical protein V495_06972 [Pseudogymnoascus sp. VKM F-4514 (FW-929)]|nr:hypothetical protein V495_06972 [Pseudogymnoascus sp. VKM F-4514 (FW-929)]
MSFNISESIPVLPPSAAVYLLLVSLPVLVISETTSSLAGHAIFKIICSTAFLSGPLLLKEWSPYDTLVIYGLALSFIGDICLIPSGSEYYDASSKSTEASKGPKKGATSRDAPKEVEISTSFKLGILAFAGAHIAYIIAFLRNTDEVSQSTLVITFAASMAAGKWLGAIYPGPTSTSWSNFLNLSIAGEMRPLVSVYATIISSMLAVAAATTAPASFGWPRQRLLGAIMFVLSDLFVATDAFGDSDVARGVKKATVRRNSVIKIAVGWGLAVVRERRVETPVPIDTAQDLMAVMETARASLGDGEVVRNEGTWGPAARAAMITTLQGFVAETRTRIPVEMSEGALNDRLRELMTSVEAVRTGPADGEALENRMRELMTSVEEAMLGSGEVASGWEGDAGEGGGGDRNVEKFFAGIEEQDGGGEGDE